MIMTPEMNELLGKMIRDHADSELKANPYLVKQMQEILDLAEAVTRELPDADISARMKRDAALSRYERPQVGSHCTGSDGDKHMTEVKYVPTPSKFLRDSGLLYEINRVVLHPLGLALAVDGDSGAGPNQVVASMFWLLDERDDPEGWVYEDTSDGKAKRDKYYEENLKKLQERFAQLGFFVQGGPAKIDTLRGEGYLASFPVEVPIVRAVSEGAQIELRCSCEGYVTGHSGIGYTCVVCGKISDFREAVANSTTKEPEG